MPDQRGPATELADTFHRHGEPDPSKWDEQEAVTGRPNDTPLRGEDEPAVPNSTLAERAGARQRSEKRVDAETKDTENKAVTSALTKAPAKRAAKKAR
jgi:hypothetical protein